MKLRPAEKADLPFVRRLYKDAFPRSERKPFSMICREIGRGRMELLSTDAVMLDECQRADRALYGRFCDRLIHLNDTHNN